MVEVVGVVVAVVAVAVGGGHSADLKEIGVAEEHRVIALVLRAVKVSKSINMFG